MQARSPEWALWNGRECKWASVLGWGLQGDLRAFFSDFQWASQLDPEGGDVGSALRSGYVLKPLDG